MQTVGVESSKSYHCGFVLAESELRRLIDTITEQLNKIDTQHKVKHTYSTKYKNGAIAETTSLDEIMAQENTGSSEIVRLKIISTLESDDSENSITVEFVNADAEDDTSTVSIRQKISGVSRDWVFVTSSLLEERITKVKRFALNQLGKTRASRMAMSLFTPILVMAVLFLTLSSTTGEMTKSTDGIESLWKQGKLKDPVEAIILLEKSRNTITPISIMYKPIVIGLSIIVSLYLTYLFFLKYYLVYVFCWGDYKELYEKKESRRKFILGVVVVGLLVSIVGGLIANNFGVLSLSFK